MSMKINSSVLSGITQAALKTNSDKMQNVMQKLATGKRINSAADDASGFTVSERLRAQINGLSAANKNAQDALSYLQVAEGGLGGVADILVRMKELAIEASNVTLSSNDRKRYQEELNYYKSEIDRTIALTNFNSNRIFSGTGAGLGSITGASELYFTSAPAEGSYTLEYLVNPGRNSVYTSNILLMNKDVTYAASNAAKIKNINGSGSIDIFHGITMSFTAGNTVSGIETLGTFGIGTYDINSNITLDSAPASEGYLELEFLDNITGTTAGGAVDVKVTFTTADGVQESKVITFTLDTAETITLGGNTFDLKLDADGNDIASGGKALYQLQTTSTGGSVVFTAGHTTGLSEGANSIAYADYSTFSTTGNVSYAWLSFDGYDSTKASGLTTELAVAKENTAANGHIKLEDIKGFEAGEFATPQVLTIFGNNKSTQISVDKSNTVDELVDQIRKAIAEGLDLGGGLSSASLAGFNETMGTGWEAMRGSIFLQGAKTGSDSDLYFSGSTALMNALGFAQVQESRENVIEATVKDSKGMVVSSGSGTGVLRNAIQGVDIALKVEDGLTVTAGAGSRLTFTSPLTPSTEHITVVNNARYAQLGPNEGQYIAITTPRIDSESLGLTGAYLLSPDAAGKTLTVLDQALERVGDIRATIGTKINALTYAMQNQDNIRLPLEQAYSRNVDADYGSLLSEFTELNAKISAGGAMIIHASLVPQIAAQLINKL